MATLNNQRIDLTYEGLLKTADNAPLNPGGGALKTVTDGAGNSTPISLNQTEGTILSNNFIIADPTQTWGIAITGSDVQIAGPAIYTGSMDFTGATVTGIAGAVAVGDDPTGLKSITQTPAINTGGEGSVSLGDGAQVNGGNGGIAIGFNTISGEGAVVIGRNAEQGDIYGTAIGQNTRGAYQGVAVGFAAQNFANYTVSIGSGAMCEQDNGIAIGQSTAARANNCIVIGNGNTSVDDAVREQTVVIGAHPSQQTKAAQYSTAVGAGTQAVGAWCTSLGYEAKSYGNYAVAIGFNSRSFQNGSVALGREVDANTPDTVTLRKLQMIDYLALDFADDIDAANGGIPLGGVYHTSGALKIRIQ